MEQSIKRIDASFSVAGQIDPTDLPVLAAQGFRTVICNRPDHEGGPEQPDHTAIEQAAQAVGLSFAYVPVLTTGATPEQAAQLRQLLNELPKPALAYCRTGNRSSKLYEAATQPAGRQSLVHPTGHAD